METVSPFSADNPSTAPEISSAFTSVLLLTPIPFCVSREEAVGALLGFLELPLGFEEVGSISVVWMGWGSSGPCLEPGSFGSVWVDRFGVGVFVGEGPKDVVQATMSRRRRM